MKISYRHSFLIIFLLFSQLSLGAACCASSNQFPFLITTDDTFQVSSTVGYTTARPGASLKWDGTWALSDYWQLSASLPTFFQNQSYLVGDAVGSLSWEVLPEFTFSMYRPRVFLMAQIATPTGNTLLGPLVKNAFQFGVGILALKTWGNVDAFFQFEIHKPLDAEFSLIGQPYWVSRGPGYSAALGGGYSPNQGNLRLGLSVSQTYDGAIQKTGIVSSTGPSMTRWSISPQLSYLWAFSEKTQISTSLTYNYSNLDEGLAFLVQYRL